MGKRGGSGGGGIPGGRCSGISPGRAPSSPVDGVCSPTTGAGGGGATPWVPAKHTRDSQSREGGHRERFHNFYHWKRAPQNLERSFPSSPLCAADSNACAQGRN